MARTRPAIRNSSTGSLLRCSTRRYQQRRLRGQPAPANGDLAPESRIASPFGRWVNKSRTTRAWSTATLAMLPPLGSLFLYSGLPLHPFLLAEHRSLLRNLDVVHHYVDLRDP
jgi:hypothetical protein